MIFHFRSHPHRLMPFDLNVMLPIFFLLLKSSLNSLENHGHLIKKIKFCLILIGELSVHKLPPTYPGHIELVNVIQTIVQHHLN